MEKLREDQLRHILPEERERIQGMFARGDFGAHTHAVREFLSQDKLPMKKIFAHVEQYLPERAELPNTGLAHVLHIIAVSIFATTAQRALALDAEEYCRSTKDDFSVNEHDIRQRFVWERSNELVDPFWE
jgi:hypothetical protein